MRKLFLIIVVAAVALDLATKALAFSRLGDPDDQRHPPRTVEVIPGVMRFETAENPGVAWGLGRGASRWVWVAVSGVAFPVILAFFLREKAPSWPFTLGLASIAGGTLGNLYDRALLGHVRDFIYVYCINFPVFNVADSFICVGAAIFALEHFLVPRKEEAKAGEGEPARAESGGGGA